MTLLNKIGFEHPIIQAPMAGVSTPALAAAVSDAGGLGSVAIGAVDPATAEKMIGDLRALTDRPFNVNVFTHAPARRKPEIEAAWLKAMQPLFDRFAAPAPRDLHEIYKSFACDGQMVLLLARLAPKVVSFHFGVPDTAVVRRLKDAGCILFANVTNNAEAKIAVDAGIDAIVAQGYEAGGHRGMFDPQAADECLDTMTLVKQLVANVRVPVIAAGGIMDGYAARRYLDEGAAAVQMGTAFLACPESGIDGYYRQALAAAGQEGAGPDVTEMTSVISGRPARCLKNDFTAWGRDRPAAMIPDYPIAYDAGKALNAAARAAGAGGYGAQWAGQGARFARSLPARDLMRTLAAEMKA